MPTYEYRCKDCGNDLEVVQAFTDDALTTCEGCGGRLRKLFGNVGISFKGSGFYKNDSRGKPASTAASADKATADKTSSEKSTSEKSGGDAGSTTTKDAPASPKKDTTSNGAGSTNGTAPKTGAKTG